MLKIAVAVVVGGILVCASDPASARFRIRFSTPAKAAIVQPAKPVAAATARPSGGVFVVVTPRPFAAAPREAPAQRAVPALADQAGSGDIGTAAAAAVDAPPVPPAIPATQEPAKDQKQAKAQVAAAPPSPEPMKAQPAPAPAAPARLASTSVRVVSHKAQPARTPTYCYVQPSGACVPF